MFTFRYAFNLTKIFARFAQNNLTLELAYCTLPFNINYHSNRLKKFQNIQVMAAEFSLLKEMVRIYRILTTVMYNVRTQFFHNYSCY